LLGGFIMQRVALTLGMAVVAATAWAADGVVHLNGPADLEQLRHSHPGHYQQALKIIDSAKELCKPHEAEIERAAAKDVACSQMLLRTSNPAKREIKFRLDDTTYIALVTMTDDPPKLVAASPP
jgi:hypothetical protein